MYVIDDRLQLKESYTQAYLGVDLLDIDDIIDAIRNYRVRISDHAYEEAQADNLSFDQIFFSTFQGEIIEDYPTDRPFPSCLIYGNTFEGQPVHTVWAYNAKNHWGVLITVYRPDPQLWINWRVRRKANDSDAV